MKFYKNLRNSAKDIPLPVWVAAAILPFGLTAMAAFVAIRAAQKPKESLNEKIAKIIEEERAKNES